MLKIKAGKVKKGDLTLALTRKIMAKLSKSLKGNPRIVVGLPSNSMPYPDGTSVVQVGFWNEFGTDKIPERPFLREALRQNKEEWLKLSRKLYKKAIKEGVPPENVLGILGAQMQLDVQKSLDSGAWEPNAPAYAKFKAKSGKTKPLIVTGHLRGSIRWAIRNKS